MRELCWRNREGGLFLEVDGDGDLFWRVGGGEKGIWSVLWGRGEGGGETFVSWCASLWKLTDLQCVCVSPTCSVSLFAICFCCCFPCVAATGGESREGWIRIYMRRRKQIVN